jgi:hypothetical protein
MMEAARTSETLVNFFQTTWRYNPEEAIFVPTAVRTSNPTNLYKTVSKPKEKQDTFNI